MILPIFLALGVVGIVYSTRRKDITPIPTPTPNPTPAPRPGETTPNVPQAPNTQTPQIPPQVPQIPIPTIPSIPAQPAQPSRFDRNPLIFAIGQCYPDEQFISASDPRIENYPYPPYAMRDYPNGARGKCVPK